MKTFTNNVGIKEKDLLNRVEAQSKPTRETQQFRQAYQGGPSAPTESGKDLRGEQRWELRGGKMVDTRARTDDQVNRTLLTGVAAFQRGKVILNKLRPRLRDGKKALVKDKMWEAAKEDIEKGNILQQACLGMAAIVGSTLMSLHKWLQVAIEHNVGGLKDMTEIRNKTKQKEALEDFWWQVFLTLENVQDEDDLVAFEKHNVNEAVKVTQNVLRSTKTNSQNIGQSVWVQVELREEEQMGMIIAWIHAQDIDTMHPNVTMKYPRVFDVPALWTKKQWARSSTEIGDGDAASHEVQDLFRQPHRNMQGAPPMGDATMHVFKDNKLFKKDGEACDVLKLNVAQPVHLGEPSKAVTSHLQKQHIQMRKLPTTHMDTLSTLGRKHHAKNNKAALQRLGVGNSATLLFAFMGAKLQNSRSQVLSTNAADGHGFGILLSTYYHYLLKFQRSFAIHPLNEHHFEGWEYLDENPTKDNPYRNQTVLKRQWGVFAKTGTMAGNMPPWVQTLVQTIMPAKDGCGCVRVIDRDQQATTKAQGKWGKNNDLTRLEAAISPPYHTNPFDKKEEKAQYDNYETYRNKQIAVAKKALKDNAVALRVHGMSGPLVKRARLFYIPFLFRPMLTARACAQFLDVWAEKVLESHRGQRALRTWKNAL